MRRVLGLVMAVALMLPGAVRADEAAAQDVIVRQLDAFQRDDFAGAFTHASPMIQSMFGTPERFAAMVRGGYPMVWRPATVRFGLSREEDGRVFQQVVLGGTGGREHVAEYELIEIGGVWLIDGVRLLPEAGAGA